MPEFSMPFGSVTNEDGVDDRVYSAEDFARYFRQFLSNGVYPNPSTGLRVDAAGTNMVLCVREGSAIIKGYTYALYDEDLQIAVAPAHLTYQRKDAIVVRLNQTERCINVVYREGRAAANPVLPELTRNDDIYELGLAEILVKSGTQVITQAEVTDTRANKAVCGYVTHVVTSIDTTAIYRQYETYLNQRIAAWNSKESQQSTDWRNQMNSQRTEFESQMEEIEGIYTALRTNIAALQTFDFDNLACFPGCVMDTEKSGAGYQETVVIAATGGKVCERRTTKQGVGYVEVIKAYDRDGVTVMKEFTITTTPTAKGYRTTVSGVYTAPDTPTDDSIKAEPNMMLKVVD